MALSTVFEDAVPNSARSAPGPRQAGKVRRTELGTFLRSRRERLSPEDVGLPPSLRRRTPGLRREEVAQLAGVGVTWYTWLEQGRPINASTQVLDSIAKTLRLDADEHSHLYRLADVPALVQVATPRSGVDPEVQQVLDELSSMACVMNERFDLLAWNAAFQRVFPGLADFRGKYRNSIWSIFTSPACCHPYLNRAEETPRLVATLRAAYAHHVGEPYWEHFISDLLERSADFGRLWARHEVAGYGTRVKIIRHAVVGQLQLRTMSLGIHSTPGTRLIIYLPVGDDTAAALRELEARQETESLPLLPCGHRFAEALSSA